MATTDPLLAPIPGAETRQLNGVQVDVAPAGNGRIKRVIYQPGFRWSTHMKSTVGTELCMHMSGSSRAAASASVTATGRPSTSRPRKSCRSSLDTRAG